MGNTDHRLRIVTMNVQLMTNDAVLNQQAVNTRANKIADAFITNRWPDVICFNEIFDEEARGILKSRLFEEWPNIAEKFGPTRTLGHQDKYMVIGSIIAGLKTGNPLWALPVNVAFAELMAKLEIPDDAGLMVLSRFPIERQKFVSYEGYMDADSFADKGVALIQVRRSPTCVYQILPTHMQASYKTEDEYKEIRASQFQQVQKLISDGAVTDFTTPDRAATIVCGDLNVQGSGMTRQEWQDLFKNATSVPFFTNSMCDSWDRFIAPGVRGLKDRGITNRSYVKNWDSRLDYLLLKDPPKDIPYPPDRRPFAVQRMFLIHPGLSDHIGIAAEINLHSNYCNPAEAKDMAGQSAGNSGHILDDGGMVWLRFAGRGTWSLTQDRNTSYEIYLPDDMSKIWSPQYTTDLGQIPYATDAWQGRFDTPVERRAFTYSIPVDQFYVRVCRRKDDAGPVRLGFYRHLGTSAYDPITVDPQSDPIGLDWTGLAAAIVNPPMEFWFRFLIRRAVSGAEHTSRFETVNPTGMPLKSYILSKPDLGSEIGELELGNAAGEDPVLSIFVTRVGEEALFCRLFRTDVNQRGFSVRWFSAMNFLTYNVSNPPILACIDETGIDVTGADEISLYMRPDQIGDPIYLLKNKEDVDSGEVVTLPGPPNSSWIPQDTGFLEKLEIGIVEDEFVGDDKFTSFITALDQQARESQYEITLKPGTGEYRLRVHIKREP